jgi:hypothetical protein
MTGTLYVLVVFTGREALRPPPANWFVVYRA